MHLPASFPRHESIGLIWTLSHQYIDQLPETIRGAVFGNVGSLISFRAGTTDAEHLAREFDHTFASSQFTDMEQYQILVRPIQDRRPMEPFRATASPPLDNWYGRKYKLIARSRDKYARQQAEVESKLNRWLTG